MIKHSHELHYWSIWFIQLQRYSDCHLQIVERKTLYFLHHWWWRYHSRKDSWNVASINILNLRFIKLHCIRLRFSVHLHSLKVSLQMIEHFSLIVHHLSFSDWWSKWTSQSELDLSLSLSYSTQFKLSFRIKLSWKRSTQLNQVESNSWFNSINLMS